MLNYCLVCRKNTENKELNVIETKSNRLMLSSKCSICGNKKSKFIKKQEAEGLLSNLGIKTPPNKIPLLNVLFQVINLNYLQNECNN